MKKVMPCKVPVVKNKIYQIRSFYPLAISKKYFKDEKEMIAHIREIVETTNKFRKKMHKKEIEFHKVPREVQKEEVRKHLEIIGIDLDLLSEWEGMLGKDSNIKDPFVGLEGLRGDDEE